jgi:hypothetical protein
MNTKFATSGRDYRDIQESKRGAEVGVGVGAEPELEVRLGLEMNWNRIMQESCRRACRSFLAVNH